MDIRTEGVQAVLGGSAILKGVDIQVGQRELVGIIGPNGSGKSTLLKCIYRVLKPTGGAVLLDGRDLDQYSYRESARRIAVVAQHNYYNFEFSVQDVVMMGRAPHKRALDRDNADDFRLVAEALELVGMSGFARRSFSTLSGTHSLWNGPQKADSHQRPAGGNLPSVVRCTLPGGAPGQGDPHWGADRLGGRAGFHLPDGPEEIRLWRWRLMDIRTEGVQAVLGGSAILKGVDIQVGQRELVGIIGPNGSGKSTLLKCIYRVLKPTGGAVLLDGRDLDQYSYRESARRIAVVAQHNYYNFEFSVQDVVMMGRAPHKRALDRDNADDFRLVAEALELVGMSGFARRSFSTLSGGEQQRVILARALAQQTPCLILDEPTNHLDIKYQLELMDIVKSLDRTVISAIHDLNIAAMYCDRLYAVKGGEIVGCGRPQEVLTEDFIRRVYEVEAKVFSDESGQLHILYHPAHRL